MVREMRKEWLNMDNIVASSIDYTGFDEKFNQEIWIQANRELICPAGNNYSGMRGNDVINLTTNTKTSPVTGMQRHTFMPGMFSATGTWAASRLAPWASACTGPKASLGTRSQASAPTGSCT